MEQVTQVTEVAKTISDYGALIVMGASFIVLSVAMWVALFNWFRKMVDKSINQNIRTTESIENKTTNIETVLVDIAESLRPTTLMQIKNISNAYFDLALERSLRIIKKVKTENHIIDEKATHDKIINLLTNLHEDRNSKFDSLHYQGRPLSSYTNREWIGWVAEVVKREVYADVESEVRAFSNLDTVYSRIKLDFYKRIN